MWPSAVSPKQMQPTRCLICTSSTSACKLASCLLFSRSGTERPGTRTNKNCLGPTYHTAVTSKGCECACMCLCHRIQVVWHSSSDVCIPGLARFKLHLSLSPVGLLLRRQSCLANCRLRLYHPQSLFLLLLLPGAFCASRRPRQPLLQAPQPRPHRPPLQVCWSLSR